MTGNAELHDVSVIVYCKQWARCRKAERVVALEHSLKAAVGESPDCWDRSPIRALLGASLMPLLILSNTLPAVIQYNVAVVPKVAKT